MTEQYGDEFQPGDIVALVSGGPEMTVIGEHAHGVAAAWFDRKDRLRTMVFPAAALMSIEPFDDTIGECAGSC